MQFPLGKKHKAESYSKMGLVCGSSAGRSGVQNPTECLEWGYETGQWWMMEPWFSRVRSEHTAPECLKWSKEAGTMGTHGVVGN